MRAESERKQERVGPAIERDEPIRDCSAPEYGIEAGFGAKIAGEPKFVVGAQDRTIVKVAQLVACRRNRHASAHGQIVAAQEIHLAGRQSDGQHGKKGGSAESHVSKTLTAPNQLHQSAASTIRPAHSSRKKWIMGMTSIPSGEQRSGARGTLRSCVSTALLQPAPASPCSRAEW